MNKTLYSYRQIRFRLLGFLSLTGVIIVLTSSTIPSTVAPPVESYDVVVVGGSSGGIGAAIGAARSGVSVVLIEDTPVLGGMISNGISNADCFSYESLSGVFDEFRYAVKAHYLADKAEMETPLFKARKKSNHIDGRAVQSNEAAAGGRWEPHVADEIFKKMAASYPNLKIYYRRFATGVLKEQNRVTGVTTDTDDKQPITFLGKTIIDATHEADIAAWAGGSLPRGPRTAFSAGTARGRDLLLQRLGRNTAGNHGPSGCGHCVVGRAVLRQILQTGGGNRSFTEHAPAGLRSGQV